MSVTKTNSVIIPAAALADQRFIRNPSLNPEETRECNMLEWGRDLNALGATGAGLAALNSLANGLGIINKSKATQGRALKNDISDDAFLTGLTGTLAMLFTTGFLQDLNRLNEAYYQKCMIENPNFSPRAAAISDSSAEFTAIEPWLAAAAALSSQQVVNGVINSAGKVSTGAAISASALGVFAPFAVSLRAFAELHSNSQEVF